MRNTTTKGHWATDAIFDLADTGRTLPRLHNPVVMRERVLMVEEVERAARHGVFAVHRKPAKTRHVAQSLRSAVHYG